MQKQKKTRFTKWQEEEKRLDKPFNITSVCRADLIHGHLRKKFSKSKALRITDAQMEQIARKLADDYCEQLFWSSLEIITDHVLND